ncbi:MAG: ACGX-repeat peptide, partial [Lachnospiraceae bacterium]|nr:ACGX-repeat peptide [Lachnospiraceae bacterium]
EKKAAAACGTACGAADKEEKPAACGTACGTGDK